VVRSGAAGTPLASGSQGWGAAEGLTRSVLASAGAWPQSQSQNPDSEELVCAEALA
jgi:hypothetical protein